jgi:hypothetical protein
MLVLAMIKKMFFYLEDSEGYPAQPELICLSIILSFCLSVKAKRRIWSKKVSTRQNDNFSIIVCWRNTTIIHQFLFAQIALDIFKKQSWL